MTLSYQKKSSPGFIEVTDPENKEGDASHNLIPSIPCFCNLFPSLWEFYLSHC